MLYMILVFGHLLASSIALGAIVATDLRMLSKLSQDKVRIAPPNEFVARLVTLALLMLYLTGAGILWLGNARDPEFLLNPKLHAKLVLVLLLTLNAFVLHRLTFPRLARGRSLGRWRARDWFSIVLPVAMSNCLWMFCAFLGIARPWNHVMPMVEVLQIAAVIFVVAVVGICAVLAAASRRIPTDRPGGATVLFKRALAAVGNLGRAVDESFERPRRRTGARRASRRPDALAGTGSTRVAAAPAGRRGG